MIGSFKKDDEIKTQENIAWCHSHTLGDSDAWSEGHSADNLSEAAHFLIGSNLEIPPTYNSINKFQGEKMSGKKKDSKLSKQWTTIYDLSY